MYIYIYICVLCIYQYLYISDFFHLDGDHGCKLCLLFGCGAKELNDNERASALSSILLPCTQPSDYLLDSLDFRFFVFAFSGLLCELHHQADTHDARRSKREEGPAMESGLYMRHGSNGSTCDDVMIARACQSFLQGDYALHPISEKEHSILRSGRRLIVSSQYVI